MTIKICSIAMNIGDGRQDIYWDSEKHCLIDADGYTDYACDTLDAAVDMAFQLWDAPCWRMNLTRYYVKPEYLDKWGEDTTESTMLLPHEIDSICRGWDVKPETIMDQLEEVPTLKYFVEYDDNMFYVKTVRGHDLIASDSFAAVGIEDNDPQFTNKLDDYLWDEYGILPEEWEVN